VKSPRVTTCCTNRRCEICAGTNRQVVIVESKASKAQAEKERQREGNHIKMAPLPPELLEKLRARVAAEGLDVVAVAHLDVHPNTLRKACLGGQIRSDVFDKITRWLLEDDDEES
jgi:hypothetical protein